MSDETAIFEAQRVTLVAHAYRMLGDMARAEDVVQEAWLRWRDRKVAVDSPKAFLLTIVTRLCLNDLDSARARREESRGDRLPEPVDLEENGLGRVEVLDQISMAFLVMLQRLTPAERAVLLLHDVFDLGHAEIAVQLGKTEAACRQLLRRAHDHIAAEKRVFRASREEHRALLRAFVQASRSGEAQQMMAVLAEDATLIVDTGPEGARVGRVRNVGRPVTGGRRIAAFLAAFARQDTREGMAHECVLNGQPAVVFMSNGTALAAILVSVADGRIRHVFVQADPLRLHHVGPLRT